MIITVFGIAGLMMILAAFAASEFGTIKIKSYPYNILNLLGSLSLGYYALVLENPVFVILEVIWAGISMYFIGKLYLKTKK